MRTVVAQLADVFRTAIRQSLQVEADPLVTPSQNPAMADYQSNAAMPLAKQVGQQTGTRTNPRAIAEQIRAAAEPLLGEMASELSVAGAGFLNVRLSTTWLATTLQEIRQDPRLGVESSDQPQVVVVDYSGPNVAKQMHVGHLRSTIIGDAISRVLEFRGDKVIRRNHIGDWGTQFGMLIAYLKQGGTRASEHIEDLEDFYRQAKRRFDEDPAFQDEARQTVVRLQGGEPDERAKWQQIVEETRRDYEPVYQRLNVKLRREHEFGESFYNPLLPAVVQDLKDAGLAVESEGATVVFIDGPDKPPVIIQKTGGGYLYATTDLAAIRQRLKDLRANRLIYTHDSRQANHFRQVFEVARKVGWAGTNVQLDYAPFGTMLGADGKPFKTRSGDTVKLKDLLNEAEERAYGVIAEKNPDLAEDQRRAVARAVGIGAVKYADLSKDRTSDYVFNWDQMLSFDGNTAPYLQNAYVRIRSIFRKAGSEPQLDTAIRLDSPHELALAKHVVKLGEVIDLVARELKPHHLCTYLFELATRFHAFYEHCPVIQSEEPLRSSRLALCDVTGRTLALGLDLLGIEHPEQM